MGGLGHRRCPQDAIRMGRTGAAALPVANAETGAIRFSPQTRHNHLPRPITGDALEELALGSALQSFGGLNCAIEVGAMQAGSGAQPALKRDGRSCVHRMSSARYSFSPRMSSTLKPALRATCCISWFSWSIVAVMRSSFSSRPTSTRSLRSCVPSPCPCH